ncbi:FAD-binding protein [Streptomyces sp. NBC_01275]|uniref:FAD-binding oxidoreductase n=1 Tax=Streptomyces sp. NBC_01275 TaxID=2903807 RepID=UPI00225A945B|nr:FAD-binding protein [Streptomyces sp. NBC_01275]MCX4766686.1 FAD-binding protein [Streptomyces sp. NBC_01275]
MNEFTRRGFLGSAAAVGGAAVVTTAAVPQAAEAAEGGACGPSTGLVQVDRADRRYQDLVSRGFNGRFRGRPDAVYVVHTADQVVDAVNRALAAGQRIAVRSGGHCFEGFVDDPAVRAVIDMSEMRHVGYDAKRRAFAVEPGATLGETYRTLYLDWGVTIPAGVCPQVGVGGHVLGGGYGPLSRRDGVVADHLYAVEVVVVDASGRARKVVATSAASDPHRELWWAHTGGGGGNFGIVTRYWFRTPGAVGNDPSALLPKAPESTLRHLVTWDWTALTEQAFTRILANHGAWHQRNSVADTPYASLHSVFYLNSRAAGQILLDVQIDGGLPGAEGLLTDFVAAINEGVGVEPGVQRSAEPWLRATLANKFDTGGFDRTKSKGAYLRKPWTDAQAAVLYRRLSADAGVWGEVSLYSYGAKVNSVPETATATAQRDSIIKVWMSATWMDPAQDDANLAWIRGIYREVFAATGGVPVPGDRTEGTFINYPDIDLADPEWNTSGVPWHTLYYKGNYPRLQRVKVRWDPGNVFRHALSVRLPD